MWDFNRYAENTAIITEKGEIIKYSYLDNMQKKFAELIGDKGAVLLISTNTLSSLVAYVSCVENGKPLIVADQNIHLETMESILERYEPHYLYLPIRKESAAFSYILQDMDYELIMLADDYILFERAGNLQNTEKKDFELIFVEEAPDFKIREKHIGRDKLFRDLSLFGIEMKIREEDRTAIYLSMNGSVQTALINSFFKSGAGVLVMERSVEAPSFWTLAVWYDVAMLFCTPSEYAAFKRMKPEKYGIRLQMINENDKSDREFSILSENKKGG